MASGGNVKKERMTIMMMMIVWLKFRDASNFEEREE
jgi:hypothetical protein